MLFRQLRIKAVPCYWIGITLLISQLTMAEPTANAAGQLAVSASNPAESTIDSSSAKHEINNMNAFQSVIKSTDENEITIKLNNERPTLALAQNSAVETPPAPRISAEQAGLFRIYRSNLLKKTYQHVIYPESAIDRNQQGDVILKLIISRDGEIKSVQYGQRADFSSLNKAAARAVKNAKPYPPAPKRLNGETFEVTMPIKFRLAG